MLGLPCVSPAGLELRLPESPGLLGSRLRMATGEMCRPPGRASAEGCRPGCGRCSRGHSHCHSFGSRGGAAAGHSSAASLGFAFLIPHSLGQAHGERCSEGHQLLCALVWPTCSLREAEAGASLSSGVPVSPGSPLLRIQTFFPLLAC